MNGKLVNAKNDFFVPRFKDKYVKRTSPKDKNGNYVRSEIFDVSVDLVYMQDFALAENGFVENDVQRIIREESASVQDSLLARIQEIRGSDTSKLTDIELMEGLVPRSVQSYFEYEHHTKAMTEKTSRKLYDDYLKQLEQNKSDTTSDSDVIDKV